MVLQNIVNIASICAQKGMQHVVLSPGSRCAPLTLAFNRHPDLKTWTLSDERAAAFVGLGMAQQSNRPVGLACTSGSAAYNYAPAIAEAFYQHIPMIIFTADRPPEWIDQLDGQTIRQREIYGKHVKGSFELPVDASHEEASWYSDRIISEAINLATTFPAGPVHVNVPVREPFYPQADETISFDQPVKVIEHMTAEPVLSDSNWEQLTLEWQHFERKVIIVGQGEKDGLLLQQLERIGKEQNIPVIGDILSNAHENVDTIRYPDIFFGKNEASFQEALQADLIVTMGRSVISKNLKIFFRNNAPKAHWHIQQAGQAADTFKALTKVIPVKPAYFLRGIQTLTDIKSPKSYFDNWQQAETEASEYIHSYPKNKPFGEFEAIKRLMKALPDQTDLHLANSMTVRYANFIGLSPDQNDLEIFANRGTSGIDGSNSTAVGHALMTNRMTVLITGDMAFFYDRNGLWNNYLPDNLRIIVMNNHAGGIFGMINGPSQQPELEEYFETRQQLNAEQTAVDFGLDYIYCNNFEQLDGQMEDFFTLNGRPKLMEIESDRLVNRDIFKEFKQQINNSYGK